MSAHKMTHIAVTQNRDGERQVFIDGRRAGTPRKPQDRQDGDEQGRMIIPLQYILLDEGRPIRRSQEVLRALLHPNPAERHAAITKLEKRLT